MSTPERKHEHKPVVYKWSMRHSGYSDRHGYVYGFFERCECGARRMVQYVNAHDAEHAHRDATEGAP